jgi:lysophospholipase L1-like esterase/ketosteroid isomerase-like protein
MISMRILLALVFAAMAPAQPQVAPSVTLPPELARVLTDYEAAWRAKDSAALSRLFAENGFVLPDSAPMVRGRAAIEELYRGKGGPLFLRAVAFAADGKSGHMIGAFANQPGGPDGGKFVLTLEKADSGKWMIASDMDNGNRPPEVVTPGQPVRGALADVGATRRYAAENAKVLPPAANENRVVFMGDSITDFWGRRYGKFFPGKPYINRGISAQVTPQMLLRFRQDVIALQPKVVVILAGTNDIGGSLGPVDVEATHSNLMSMADLARAHGIKVVLSGMTPLCDYISPQTVKRPVERLKQMNDWIKDYAARNGVVYLDYWTAMVDAQGMLRKELTWDGLHPNDAGYDVMEPLAETAIAAALR